MNHRAACIYSHDYVYVQASDLKVDLMNVKHLILMKRMESD